MTTTCEWEEGMGEISGFGKRGEDGARYEASCRAMLRAGVRWLEEHPDNPRFKTYEDVTGVIFSENDAAKAMMLAMNEAAKAAGGGAAASGAMMQTTVGAALFIAREGWPAYVALMSKKKERIEP